LTDFTPAQKNAIDARNCNIIVSAAAGSGKTAVIIERLKRMLSDSKNKLPVDKIVVVTFTNDAAAQMKQRLNTAFEELLAENPDDEWVAKQQAALADAKISTVHSFCFALLRENSDKMEFTPDFRVIDENELAVIEEKAVEETIREYCENNHDELKTLDDFFYNKSNALSEIIVQLYHSLLNIPHWKRWLDDYIVKLGNMATENNGEIVRKYLKCLNKELSADLMECALAKSYLESEYPSSKMCDIISQEYACISDAVKSLVHPDLSFDEKTRLLQDISFAKANYSDIKKEYGAEIAEEVKQRVSKFRDKYKDHIKSVVSTKLLTLGDIWEDIRIHHTVLGTIRNILLRTDELITEKKLGLNALSFSDAEHMTISLLTKENSEGKYVPSKLCRELSEYYEQIIIDEYQDTNDVQEVIFRLLSCNGKKLFVVGDIKQSIYGFRGANPGIFRHRFLLSEDYTENSDGDARINLNRNFRSSNDVVKFVNLVFGQIMNPPNSSLNYGDEDKLVYSAEYSDDIDRTTEILICESLDNSDAENYPDSSSDNEEYTEKNGPENSIEDIVNESAVVATRIKDLINAKTPVKTKDGTRPCRPSDFCILMRGNKSAALFADELAKYGIKAAADDVKGYLKSREISVLINFLRIIDNPLRDVPLASVLMSPLFTLTKDDMLKIRSFHAKGALYRAVSEALKHGCDESWYHKLCRFSESYERLRIAAAGNSIERLINTIYDSTDFLAIVRVYTDGAKKRGNLRLLLSYAKNYESSSNGGLSGFLRHIDNVLKSGKDFVQASVVSGSDDAVSIKTIHKSKGLEYPFVFVCMLDTEFNKSDTQKRIILNRSFEGIALKIQKRSELKYYDSVLGYIAKNAVLDELVNEEMRLLYVALTRAKERLFVTLSINNKTLRKLQNISEFISLQTENGSEGTLFPPITAMIDWMFITLLNHPDSTYLRSLAGTHYCDNSIDFRLEYSVNNVDSAETVQEKRVYAKPDPKTVEEIKRNIDFCYDKQLSETEAKLTVTEITHDANAEITMSHPKFTYSDGTLTGAEKGTATHLFMQYCDLALAEKDVCAERDRLRDNGILGVKESGAVEIEKLEKFFLSELYARMKSAEKIQRERKFLIRIDDLGLEGALGEKYRGTDGMLQGVADCIFFEDGEIVLIDYKTDRNTSEKKLTDAYGEQLRLYKSALEKIYGMKVRETVIYSFDLGKEIVIK